MEFARVGGAAAFGSTVRGFVARTVGRLTIRGALLLGSTVVFALWLASAYYLTERLAEIEALSSATRARHEQGQELLLTVRAQVLLGSIYLRDALDGTDADTALFYN